MMVWRLPTFAVSANIYFTLNNDSTTKYYSGGTFFDGTTYNIHDTFFWLNASASTGHRGYVIIDNVNKSVPQIINGIGNNTAFTNGMWTGLAPVTSIEFKTGSTMTGTIYLYGIAA
jgi:hypothetical protein